MEKQSLAEYLACLNSSENQWGIWVNPCNLDDYRIGQFIFENGGMRDGKVCIGSLDSLSYGFQSESNALKSFFEINRYTRFISEIQYEGKKVLVNPSAIIGVYFEGKLDKKFYNFLKKQADAICSEWAKYDAESAVEELENRFALEY